MTLYEGIDEKQQVEVADHFAKIGNLFNNGDMLIKNYIVNVMFNFLDGVIQQKEVKETLKDAYNLLE